MAEAVKPETGRSDSLVTDGSVQSMDDVQPPSPTDPINSASPVSPGEGEASNQFKPEASAGRRRKIPDSVTPNACTSCKKARAKVRLCFPVFLSPPGKGKESCILSYRP